VGFQGRKLGRRGKVSHPSIGATLKGPKKATPTESHPRKNIEQKIPLRQGRAHFGCAGVGQQNESRDSWGKTGARTASSNPQNSRGEKHLYASESSKKNLRKKVSDRKLKREPERHELHKGKEKLSRCRGWRGQRPPSLLTKRANEGGRRKSSP